MRHIEELHDLYVRITFGMADWRGCVSWAVDRMMLGEEGDDNDVILLASSTDEKEVYELAMSIIQKYLPREKRDLEYWAGKYVVRLYEQFQEKEIDFFELESIMLELYCSLDYPDWLVMLSRNCELATDVSVFEKPFKDEFEYIAGLWRSCNSVDEFKERYDRRISDTHDIVAR